MITADEIGASGLDYLALGHWHSSQRGRAGTVAYAYAGAPEAVALDQDRAGKVLLVELEETAGKRTVRIEEHPVGATHFEKRDVDAAAIASAADAHRAARARQGSRPRPRRSDRRCSSRRAGPGRG
ncbi:MAG: hypothetical protein WKF78_03450 [Candidatus Limnocylindrales bacterium]